MWQNFGALKDSTIGEIAGVSTASSAFRDKLNEATRRLLRRGDFPGTTVPIFVCIINGCLVMPRYVNKIRKVNFCNREVPVKGLWWQFLDVDRSCGWGSQYWSGWLGQQVGFQDSGRSPIVQDIMGDGRTVRYYKSTPLDNQKSLTIFGTDTNGDTLFTKGSGAWTEGYRLVLPSTADFAETPMTVRNITRVLRDKTQGFGHLYAYNQATALLEDLSHYEPSETNPNYAKYKVLIPPTGSPGCCGTSRGVLALVKLAYVPVQDDNDLVLIDNIDALKAEIQAVRFGEAGDFQSKVAFEADAVQELNRQAEDETPDNQIPITSDPFSGTGIGQMHVF